MGVEIARRTAELARVRPFLQLPELLLEPDDEHFKLFAQTGGGGGLSVRMGQHRNIGPQAGAFGKHVQQFAQGRHIDLGQRFLERERRSRVVDVLRREPEVNEFAVRGKSEVCEAFLQEILHGLDVVVRPPFNLLDTGGVFLGEVAVDGSKLRIHRRVDVEKLGKRLFAKGDEILHSLFSQSKFALSRREASEEKMSGRHRGRRGPT